MEEKLGVDAINAAADEMIAKIIKLRDSYLADAKLEPENFCECSVEDAYVWMAESLF